MNADDLALADVDAVITTGDIVHLRDLGPADLGTVRALHERVTDRTAYLRFFSPSRPVPEQYLERLVQAPDRDHHSTGAFVGDELAGIATFERTGTDRAEFALLVSDDVQGRGLGTLLFEHLIATARTVGFARFDGEVLTVNSGMLAVVHRLGYPATMTIDGPITHVAIDLCGDATARAAVNDRDAVAEHASLAHLLSPASVVVVGAGRRPGGVGHEILHNLMSAGFAGAVYAVNPHARHILSIPCFASVAELPAPAELAVIAVPAAQVPDVLRACGARGCRAAVVVAAGFGEAGAEGCRRQQEILAIARHHGMRLLGPNCLGLLNTDPAVRLDATFATRRPRRPGHIALLSQSGAFGGGLLAAADRIGTGFAHLVTVGNKVDVGGNDLLLAWAQDPRVRVIGMYLESFGDPLRFARIAEAVSRQIPVLALKSGRTEAGRRAGMSHTAAAAAPDAAVDALLRRSGVLRMSSMEQMLDAARVLAGQPLPAGSRIAVVGNSGGPEILATDAASAHGLVVDPFDEQTVAQLEQLGVPSVNPLDLGANAEPAQAAAALRIVQASPSVDAVITVFTDIATVDIVALRRAVMSTAAASAKPTVAVEVGGCARTLPMAGSQRSVPVFAYAEPAVAALSVAARYAEWRRRPHVPAQLPGGLDTTGARRTTRTALISGAQWLRPDEAARLLDSYGIARCEQRIVDGADDAVAAAAEWGYPVVAKLASAGAHKTELNGVRTGLADEVALREAVTDLLHRSPDSSGVLVQPQVGDGVELIAGAVRDPDFGPLVMLGAGGIFTDIAADRSLRLAPVSDADAAEMIADLRVSPLLDGFRGASAVDRAAVRDVLVRLGALVTDVPDIAELDLNPLIGNGPSVIAVDARVRVAVPPALPDPLTRSLRGAQP